jgi:hypothetical protein
LVFKLNKCTGGTQILRTAIKTPKPFLNQYALDISGVSNKISLNIWALKLYQIFSTKGVLDGNQEESTKTQSSKEEGTEA